MFYAHNHHCPKSCPRFSQSTTISETLWSMTSSSKSMGKLKDQNNENIRKIFDERFEMYKLNVYLSKNQTRAT